MPNVGRRKGKVKNHAGKNNGPSRERYWRNGTLKKHKVRNLIAHNKMSHVEAVAFWNANREGRMKS